jgi:hypothetical protein
MTIKLNVMKKFRMILMSFIILIAVGGAFATTDPPCVYEQQYYRVGQAFYPTGTYGVSYVCMACPFACTYYLPDPVLQPNNYFPCRTGMYFPLYL